MQFFAYPLDPNDYKISCFHHHTAHYWHVIADLQMSSYQVFMWLLHKQLSDLSKFDGSMDNGDSVVTYIFLVRMQVQEEELSNFTFFIFDSCLYFRNCIPQIYYKYDGWTSMSAIFLELHYHYD